MSSVSLPACALLLAAPRTISRYVSATEPSRLAGLNARQSAVRRLFRKTICNRREPPVLGKPVVDGHSVVDFGSRRVVPALDLRTYNAAQVSAHADQVLAGGAHILRPQTRQRTSIMVITPPEHTHRRAASACTMPILCANAVAGFPSAARRSTFPAVPGIFPFRDCTSGPCSAACWADLAIAIWSLSMFCPICTSVLAINGGHICG